MGAESIAATAQFTWALSDFKANGGLYLFKGIQDFANNLLSYTDLNPQPWVAKEMLHF